MHIFVNDATSSAVVLHTTGGEATEEAEATEEGEATATCVPPTDPAFNLTPPKKGEYRCGTMENKLTGQQSELSAHLQLQADMVLR